MSAIASFTKVPNSSIPKIKKAAMPTKRFFGGTKDDFHHVLQEVGQEVAQYEWSGYVLGTLLPFLDERHGINLMNGDQQELATFLSQARSSTVFVLSPKHRSEYLSRLDPALFNESELQAFYREFTETDDPVGQAMMDGIRSIRTSLQSVDDESLIILEIG